MTAHLHNAVDGTPVDRSVAIALAGSAAISAVVPAEHVIANDLAGNGSTVDSRAFLAWRWVVGTAAIDLYATGTAVSPHWHATYLGAGAAVHRARVALAADGYAARVTLLPDPEALHLAHLVTAGPLSAPDALIPKPSRQSDDAPVKTDRPAVLRSQPTAESRRAARGAVRELAVLARGVMRELTAAARAEGVRLRLVQDGPEFSGVLHGPDTPEAWLRAGAALSAVRLVAARHELATTPVLTNDATGGAIARTSRRLISDREGWLGVGIGSPYVRLRLTPRPVAPTPPETAETS